MTDKKIEQVLTRHKLCNTKECMGCGISLDGVQRSLVQWTQDGEILEICLCPKCAPMIDSTTWTYSVAGKTIMDRWNLMSEQITKGWEAADSLRNGGGQS